MMPYIDPNVIADIKNVDLLTYLRECEPDELVHHSGNTYRTRTHDSLKISNGKWMWWSRGIGGRTALDYLIKVRGCTFMEAVETIMGSLSASGVDKASGRYSKECSAVRKADQKHIILPERSENSYIAMSYLLSRGIDKEIIEYCISNGLIYESLPYHNVVFTGHDAGGNIRYASYRAASERRIMGDVKGSDKRYSFRLPGKNGKDLHLFECAIDALSFATLIKLSGGEWQQYELISLSGVHMSGAKGEMKYPPALQNISKKYPNAVRIYLHFDNDITGRGAAYELRRSLEKNYQVIDMPPRKGKDYNDHLRYRLGILETKGNGERGR